MKKIMINWPFEYKILCAGATLFLVLVILGYLYFLRPWHIQLRRLEEKTMKKISFVTSHDWPVEPGVLEKLNKNKRQRLISLKENLQSARKMAVNTFADNIREAFGVDSVEDPNQFINYATRLDYQERYSQTIEKWRERGVKLHPAVLNLEENSVSPYIYRLLLQLWTVDAVLEEIMESGLDVVSGRVTVPASGDKDTVDSEMLSIRSALVKLHPVRTYLIEEESEVPFLLEYPVEITLQGNSKEIELLLENMREKDRWISIDTVEIRKQPMNNMRSSSFSLEAVIIFTTFYPLQNQEEIELMQLEKSIVPPGA